MTHGALLELCQVWQCEPHTPMCLVCAAHAIHHLLPRNLRRAGESPDLTPHPEWLRQSELFSVLKGMAFFQQWRVRSVSRSSTGLDCGGQDAAAYKTLQHAGPPAAAVLFLAHADTVPPDLRCCAVLLQAFGVWKHATLTLRFQRRAKALDASLLCKHPAVRSAIQEAHWLCLHLSASAVPQPAAKPAHVQPRHSLQAAVAVVTAAQVLHYPAAAPSPGSAGSAGNATSVASSSSQPSSNAEPVWQRGSTYGQWQLVQPDSERTPAADAPQAGAASRHNEAAKPLTLSAAGASALVDELAHAAKGMLPQLQSRCSSEQTADTAVTAPSTAGRERPGLEEQMQAACAHSSKLLKVLCDALQPEVETHRTGVVALSKSCC